MNDPNSELSFRAGLDTAHGGELLTPYEIETVGDGEGGEWLCIWCEAETNGVFCSEECYVLWHAQRRAERKVR